MSYKNNIEELLGIGQQWPPKGEQTGDPSNPGRLDRYAANKDRFDGRAQQAKAKVILERVRDRVAGAPVDDLQLLVNIHGRLSRLFTDFLWVEQPSITDGKKDQKAQDFIDAVVKESRFYTQGVGTTVDMSRYGTGLYRARWDPEKVNPITGTPGMSIIEAQPTYLGRNSAWFPVHAPMNVKQVTHHVLAYQDVEMVKVGTGAVQRDVLHAEIHTPGFIERRKLLLQKGKIVGHLEGSDLAPVPTGVDGFLLFPVHNLELSDTIMGRDDYSDIDTLVAEIENRLAKVSSILDKHSDPKMYGPAGAVTMQPDGSYAVDASTDYFPVQDGEAAPGYLVWDANLEACWKEIETILDLIYVISETSPAAFGQIKAGLAESGSALKRLLVAPLVKSARLRNAHNEVIPHVFQAAADLARVNGTDLGVGELDVQVDWQDGLPQDMTESMAVETQAVQARLTTRKAAMGRLYGLRGKALDDAYAEVEAEQDADKPQVPVVQVRPNPGGVDPKADPDAVEPDQGEAAAAGQ